MSVPVRVLGPSGAFVELADLKAHLRVDGDDDDAYIQGLYDAAMAHLDGWRGVLGRCIQSQQWAVTFDRAGKHTLPFPDVTEVSAENDNGDPVTSRLCHDARGSFVELSGPATVTLTAALPEDARHVVIMAIKLLVGHWYENREAVTEKGGAEIPLSVTRLVTPLTVWRV